MKTFKEFIEEAHLSVYRGVKLFPTDHAKQRELERHIPKSSLLDIHKKVVDKIKNREYNPPQGKSFMVFDRERKQSVVFDYRQDKLNKKDNRHHLFVVTGYNPNQEGKPRHGQDKLVTENGDIYVNNIDVLEV